MVYDRELDFLREVFLKVHVRTSVLTAEDVRDAEARFAEAMFGTDGHFLLAATREAEPETVYYLTDAFGLSYLYFLLPQKGEPTLFFVGPYLSAPLSEQRLLEIGERNGITPKRQRDLKEYVSAIPVLERGSLPFVMLNCFCERIWNSPSFAIAQISSPQGVPASPLHDPRSGESFDDTMVNIKTMEQRYAFENELIRAVSLGQLHKEDQLLFAFSDQTFEKRLADPLRNAKNYTIIMNTLLRKAAESGGVHPVYLDRISSSFAAKIEQQTSLADIPTLMREMFRAYCRLVRKHSLKHFSLVVQKTVLLIDSDLSAPLSPRALADYQNISLGYLSTVFRRETGKTLSQYVREKRIRHAAHLLETTKLQIQTVALHCGMMDVQYFSKLFKKQMGKSPKEYRESLRELKER